MGPFFSHRPPSAGWGGRSSVVRHSTMMALPYNIHTRPGCSCVYALPASYVYRRYHSFPHGAALSRPRSLVTTESSTAISPLQHTPPPSLPSTWSPYTSSSLISHAIWRSPVSPTYIPPGFACGARTILFDIRNGSWLKSSSGAFPLCSSKGACR